MLKTIFYRKLRIGEFIQFMKQLLEFCKESNPELLGVSEQVNKLELQWMELKELFKKALGSDLTTVLEEQDERRDIAITGLRLFFVSLTYHFNTSKIDAAQKLQNVIDKYGRSIARKNYQEESAILSSILKDWDGDQELIQAISLLDVADWKDELLAANNAFDEVYRQRTGDLIAIPEASATKLREPVIEAYMELIKHLSAHITLALDPKPYKDLAALLNGHIDQYNQLVRNRYGTAVDEEEEAIDTAGSPEI
jgi:hypothetical protein